MARTEPLPKSRHKVYLDRAEEFSRQMVRAASEKAWNSVGLLGVHSVISACDALTVRLAGVRWSGQDHSGLLSVVSSLKLIDAPLRQISDVLEKKNEVEYESRVFTEKEAEEVQRRAMRVLTWVTLQVRAG
jgi:HEPN domain-containing protein